MDLDSPIYVAFQIIEAFSSFEDATVGGIFPAALKTPLVQGSTDSINAALDFLRNIKAGRTHLAIEMAQQYWKATRHKSPDRYEEGRKQDEKYLIEVLKRETWWGIKK